MIIDSRSKGDEATFLDLDALRTGLDALPEGRTDIGSVALVVIRGDGGRRETPDRVTLHPVDGVRGDAWGRDRRRDILAQIAVMEADVARLISNGQPLALFGDALFFDLDLSVENLPPGSRLRVGTALLEVTPQPHTGCSKFRSRFGADALRLVSAPDLGHRRLRGVYMRVMDAGVAGPGDVVLVEHRGAALPR
ncbi:MAG TPA: MOSC domain-containing protein [Vicinamibacteria bacterium]